MREVHLSDILFCSLSARGSIASALHLTALRPKWMGVFSVVKRFCHIEMMVLTACIGSAHRSCFDGR